MQEREKFSTRIGFILISAGCAIGLGNVWRFPYIVGKYGGAAFVLIYLFFLFAFGLPIMACEFSVGRASKKSVAKSFHILQPKGSKWHLFSYFGMIGNYLLMMFYTTIAGWMLAYLFYMIRGDFVGKSSEQIGGIFDSLLASPTQCIFWMIVICAVSFGICAMGVQNGVERITKWMMTSLFAVLIILVIRSVTLENASKGLEFYLKPNLSAITGNGISGVWEAVYAAMGQAFFTLSIGMGSMAIFGSYLDRDRALFGESISITLLDTFVAFMAGLVIFPACFAFGVNPQQGPGLVFITLPNIFNEMPMSQLWGGLFFVFMSFAALSTVIAVFENIISFAIDLTGCTRKKAVAINVVAIILLSIPCALSSNILAGVTFAPIGNILDLEDFIVSNNVLPLGSLVYVAFCMTKYGWGFDNFFAEVNAGKGVKFPAFIRTYCTYVLPIIILAVFFMGYVSKFS